jgi:hypothetical protein
MISGKNKMDYRILYDGSGVKAMDLGSIPSTSTKSVLVIPRIFLWG